MAHTVSDNPFTPRFSFPFTHPESKRTTKQVAQRCPVCEGRTTVPVGFYGPEDALSGGPVECRTCWGRGLVYVSESTG